jgi:hypothetical protein
MCCAMCSRKGAHAEDWKELQQNNCPVPYVRVAERVSENTNDTCCFARSVQTTQQQGSLSARHMCK